MADKEASPVARVVLQQCLHATLQVKPADEHEEAQYVQIDRGMVVYVCFFKGATEEILPKMVSSILNIRLCETYTPTTTDSGSKTKMASILELPGDILIVPQATLGGKVKGRVMQYHNNVCKEDGLRLYARFVSMCEQETQANNAKSDAKNKAISASDELAKEDATSLTAVCANVSLKHGTYGNRQVLRLDTNGPYTHLMEF